MASGELKKLEEAMSGKKLDTLLNLFEPKMELGLQRALDWLIFETQLGRMVYDLYQRSPLLGSAAIALMSVTFQKLKARPGMGKTALDLLDTIPGELERRMHRKEGIPPPVPQDKPATATAADIAKAVGAMKAPSTNGMKPDEVAAATAKLQAGAIAWMDTLTGDDLKVAMRREILPELFKAPESGRATLLAFLVKQVAKDEKKEEKTPVGERKDPFAAKREAIRKRRGF